MNNRSVGKFGIYIVLICCFSIAAFSQSAPFGYLESAADSRGNTAIPNGATLIVSGWAVDNQDAAPVAGVQILIDGKLVGNATLGSDRPDIAAAYGDSFLKAGWTAAIVLKNLANGTHTVSAVATNSLALSSALTGVQSITVTWPDLSAGQVSVAGTPVAGGKITVAETTSNVGSQTSATWSLTRFYLNTTPTRGGSQIGSRMVAALPAGAASGPVTTTATLPAGVAGQYYVVACANDTSSVPDSNPANNCAATAAITVGGPDLSEAVVAPGTAAAGATIQISDTVKNEGAGSASYSITRFYLNKTATKGGTVLGTRTVSPIAAGVTSAPVTTTLTLPAGTGGAYHVLACANDTNTVADSNPANNCASAPITIAAADLALSMTAPSFGFSGRQLQISNSVANQGTGAAGWSATRFYLNTTPVRGGTLLGMRSISSVAPGAIAGPASTAVTIPTSLSAGQYYVIGCANDTNTVADTNPANNCVTTPLNVYIAAQTVVVDPANAADPYDAAACGTIDAPCKSIVNGVAVATVGKTVLVFPGTYEEQVTIDKNITLISAVRHQAVIKAPADVKLAADADNHQTLVTVSGGATSVTVKDMTVAGPVFADSCTDNIYGIYVKNANATITGNKVDAIRQANSALWGCQPGVGIRFGARALAYVGHGGTISNNVINGPAKAGVVVDGDNTTVNVSGNTITGLDVAGVVGQNGIQISRGAKGTIEGNSISGFRYGDTMASQSAAGILVYDIAGGVTLRNNTITGNDEGIGVYSVAKYLPDGSPDYNTQFSTNVVIKGNQLNDNAYLGIHIDPFSKGNTIWNNTAKGHTAGWDVLDEHPDFKFNNWGTDSSNFNTVDSAHAGLVFTY
ncbi:MAG TPA: CARDB domain-containing protein [Clostridia bacterium]|nr:CARDB domain-containing protein [Clostridia bacterium]